MFPWHSNTTEDYFATVRETKLSKLVRDDLLQQILGGQLPPGARINEPDVAARLGVSRVPVREALRELESSGLVVARKHAGVFVRELDADEIRGLYDLRSLLDGYAGRRTAQLTLPQRLDLADALDESIAVMRAAADVHDVSSYYAENLRFHWLLVEAADNLPVVETYRGVVQKLHLSRLKNLSQDTGMRVSIAEHVEIAQALRDGDAARCEALLASHVHRAFGRLGDTTDP
ncbi:putative HTH-type transcriptional regulator YdfH [Pigmentiphaga humi]|uniref:Putative HTH-type transcriptional regulator YdfH n=1 Tax=Pigmentiphaga humi TaxID=2478468 RepID=A0A3P4AZL2_9BURK|nr:FCD domain-containing protein [Pigmentiphaga humi]VCU68838.1 putative HTH-type transcriptional regulator YdfH [Pigmentiphaga humi]